MLRLARGGLDVLSIAIRMRSRQTGGGVGGVCGYTLGVRNRTERAVIFAPSALLTVAIEGRPDTEPEIYVHAGGQGVWIARMLATFGAARAVCYTFGSESGAVLVSPVERAGIEVYALAAASGYGAEGGTAGRVHGSHASTCGC